MSKSRNRVVGITMGDPAGVGPEIIAQCLRKSSMRSLGHFVIIGDRKILYRYIKKIPPYIEILDLKNASSSQFVCGQATLHGARASLEYLDKAIKLLRSKEIKALVTAPICKETISVLKNPFVGHTEYLADAFGIKRVVMMFVTKNLKTVVATRHIPLNQVSQKLTSRLLWDTIKLTHENLVKSFMLKNPRIAVCGLNPHAGENGKIGREEGLTIIPTLKKAKKHKMQVFGPFAADTLFFPANAKSYDVIISMYHDQGLIPLKTMDFFHLVNLTVGLPFVRTSPAHGTAFNIAGKSKADPSSMFEAIRLASQLTQ